MKKAQKIEDFKILEQISKTQRDIKKGLLLYCSEKTARQRAEQRRKNQLEDLKKLIMPEFSYSNDPLALKHMAKQWWNDEIKWQKKYFNKYDKTVIIKSLSYRLLVMFFSNHIACPFYTESHRGRKPDNKDFQKENQKLFIEFLNQLIKVISFSKKNQFLNRVFGFFNYKPQYVISSSKKIQLIKELKKINISKSFYSAAHKLYGKDWDITKNLLVGGTIGAAVSIPLGPVIGSYIGKLAGFSGAAATSYGLALLGGGSLASGGFGMAGGSFILGLGFGVSNGVKQAVKNTSIDELNTMQTQALLPALLAIGRAQFEIGDKAIPDFIHKTISKRLKESKQRLKELKNEHDKTVDFGNKKKIENLKRSIQSVKKSVKLYKRAKDMSQCYNWKSGYDMWKKISWAS